MYAIARRSNTDQNVIRMIRNRAHSASGNTAALNLYTSKKVAAQNAKAMGSEFFVVTVDVSAAPKLVKAPKETAAAD